jgi:predicted nucleic acid-binding protein
VKAFLDTSVLVAAFYDDHPRHEPSFALFAAQRKSTGCTAAHCLAEFYSVATGMPGKNRAGPLEALQFLGGVQERLAVTVLDEVEYRAVLDEAAEMGLSGGAIYDALIAGCAVKANAQAVYTWNTRHFRRFAQIAGRVREP